VTVDRHNALAVGLWQVSIWCKLPSTQCQVLQPCPVLYDHGGNKLAALMSVELLP